MVNRAGAALWPNFASENHLSRPDGIIRRWSILAPSKHGRYSALHMSFDLPILFEPLFMRGAEYGAAEWSDGFLCGFQFDERAWSLLVVGQPTWFAPFLRLGTEAR